MSGGYHLNIQPPELKFPFELKKQSSCRMQLTNKTDQHVAFKVKTTNPKEYCVRPNAGIVTPGATCDVTVTMQAQKEAPPDMKCKDKFLVQSVAVERGVTYKDISSEMFNKAPGKVVEELKLRVVYITDEDEDEDEEEDEDDEEEEEESQRTPGPTPNKSNRYMDDDDDDEEEDSESYEDDEEEESQSTRGPTPSKSNRYMDDDDDDEEEDSESYDEEEESQSTRRPPPSKSKRYIDDDDDDEEGDSESDEDDEEEEEEESQRTRGPPVKPKRYDDDDDDEDEDEESQRNMSDGEYNNVNLMAEILDKLSLSSRGRDLVRMQSFSDDERSSRSRRRRPKIVINIKDMHLNMKKNKIENFAWNKKERHRH